MLSKIKGFFNAHFCVSEPADTLTRDEQLHLACACLFVEMVRMDHEIKDEEQTVVKGLIKEKFGLDEKDIDELLNLAEEEAKHSTDYFQFTRLINDSFNEKEKIQLIENLWQIAYADAHLDIHEEHLIRKISELLYVSHKDFIAAKHKAANEL